MAGGVQPGTEEAKATSRQQGVRRTKEILISSHVPEGKRIAAFELNVNLFSSEIDCASLYTCSYLFLFNSSRLPVSLARYKTPY